MIPSEFTVVFNFNSHLVHLRSTPSRGAKIGPLHLHPCHWTHSFSCEILEGCTSLRLLKTAQKARKRNRSVLMCHWGWRFPGRFNSVPETLPGQVDVVAQSGASLQRQRGGQHFEDGVHGPSFPQSLVQRLDVDAAGDEVGQQQEEVKTLETWETESVPHERRGASSSTTCNLAFRYLTQTCSVKKKKDPGIYGRGLFLTCLLGAEVLQRISSRVGVKQQDGKTEVSVGRDHRTLLGRRTGNKRGRWFFRE